ncbi:protein kinase [Planctomycetota bacterium]
MAKGSIDIKNIFAEALEKKTDQELETYLDKACQGNKSLREQVEALLRAYKHADHVPDAPIVDLGLSEEQLGTSESLGTTIGPYKLLEKIGEGGMAVVYMAQQEEPIHRKVALKILKPGMDSKQIIARFAAEKQTLAMMNYPIIAKVHDAGVAQDGRPYFVMEYVEGLPITKYCDEHKLSIKERLSVFKQVCEGVHHAHQKGIIHRDIKPSNILIYELGDKAVPKIIDFGVAKAIAEPLADAKSFTHHGQLVGTPEYMSPEQVDMATQDIDTRSDIYSLGVLLYELLAGILPYERDSFKNGFNQIQRTIQEEEPATPSTKLTGLGDKAKEIAERRSTQLVPLTRCLYKELEWIPMKAMRKDRSRRYRSASELSDDIQNYLTGAPLIAGPESNVYRARKFVRKHAGFVASAALVAVVIILGLITSTAFSISAEKARGEEAAARTEAEQAYAQAEQAHEKEVVARTQAEQARDKEAALRVQVEQALARAEKAEQTADEQRKLAEERAEDYRRSLYVNRVALADASYTNGKKSSVRELLQSCPEDLRGWEWDRLNHISSQQPVTILRGYRARPLGSPASGSIDTFPLWNAGALGPAISPDGTRIASCRGGETITIWDVATGTEVMTLKDPEDNQLRSVAFSPTRDQIVSGTSAGTIIVWDVATGAQVISIEGHETVSRASFSPDGTRIVSSSRDTTVRVWDATTGTELLVLRGHKAVVFSAVYSPDGKRIVSAGAGAGRSGQFTMPGMMKVWDGETGAELMTLRGHKGIITSVAFSPDGKRIVSGGFDKTVRVWNAENGVELMTLRAHEGFVYSVAFSPDSKRIVSGSLDNLVKVWDAVTGDAVTVLQGHRSYVLSVAFSPTRDQIISSSSDGTIRVWDDISTDRDQMILRGYSGLAPQYRAITSVAFSPDGKQAASGHKTNSITLWDIATGRELASLRGHRRPVNSIGFSPDGKRIVSGSGDNLVKVWDAATLSELMTLQGHKQGVESVAFSPDGKRIVSGSVDKTIKLWDATSGAEEVTLQGHTACVSSVAFSPNGKRVVSADRDNLVKVWDAATGVETMTLQGHEAWVYSVAFSPDGKHIASASSDRTVKVWNAASGAEVMTLRGHQAGVMGVAFSPDGQRIISGANDNMVKIWHAATGLEVMTLRPRNHNVRALTFSPDGKTIASCNDDCVTLWETDAPIDGYAPRQTANAARTVVDNLFQEHRLYTKIIDTLEADNTLEEPVRQVALEIANARLWQVAGEQKKEPSSVTTVPAMNRNSTDDTTASGLDTLQGTWVGHMLGREGRGEVKWTFSGNNFHYTDTVVWFKGTFIVNEELVPKQVDLTVTEGSAVRAVGATLKNIYELKNDSLILAGSPRLDVETRRSDFEPSGPGSVFQLKLQPSNQE